jgi:hypothetical protein
MDLRPNSERPAETDVSTFLTGLTQVIWSSALGAGFAAAAAYLAIAAIFGINHLAQGPGPHFIYLADAFLHGKLFLLALPGETTDLVLYGGEYYVYYPPLPALVCLPLVALLGTGFSDTLLTIALGGLNVSLVSVLLSSLQRDGLIVLSPEKKAWLTAFFALGTVHLSTAPHPSSCGMASLLGFAMLCGSYIASLRLSGLRCALVAGTLVACAFASRNTLILPGLFMGSLVSLAEGGARRSTVSGQNCVLGFPAGGRCLRPHGDVQQPSLWIPFGRRLWSPHLEQTSSAGSSTVWRI